MPVTSFETKVATSEKWSAHGNTFLMLFGFAIFCLVAMIVSLLLKLNSFAFLIGWTGVAVAIIAIIVGFMFTLK